MPFTRISLLEGRSPDYLDALSASLHRALVESLEVPAADLFQVIHQHHQGELRFDRNYLGGPRSDAFVLFHVTIGRPRSATVKQEFFRNLVEQLSVAPGIRGEDVMVVIASSDIADWSFSNGRSAAAAGEMP